MSDWRRLSVVTAATTFPITTNDAKVHLRVTGNDEDRYIYSLIQAACGMIDGPDGIGYAVTAQTWKLTCDTFPDYFEIPLGGSNIAVTEVGYLDAAGTPQVVAGANYRVIADVDPVRVEPAVGFSWPGTRQASGGVYVKFTAGGNPPLVIRQAILLIVGHLYANREAVGPGNLAPVPMAVESILNQYRRGWAA
jgi:uncharacterized phiE125 gp8 family phage protein